MADNVTLPATGSVVSCDEIGGVIVQRVKVQVGADGVSADVNASNPMPVATTPGKGQSSVATRTTVSGTTGSVLLLDSNTDRRGATVTNDSTSILYIMTGAGTASSSNYDYKLFQDDVYVVDAGFVGQIRGSWVSATGQARIVEYT